MAVKRNAVQLNTAAHRPAWDQFVHHVNSASSREGWRTRETIGYFLDAAFRSMRGPFLAPAAREKNEEDYIRIVKRCRADPSATMDDLSKMLGALILALEAEPIDFIGPVYSEFAASSPLGQFFTPHALSRVMAEMIMEKPEEMLAQSGRPFITLQEPACGVGGMTLAACAVLRDRGFDLARQIHWSMIDIDYSAMCAAYLQVNLCGISADVYHGNALSLEAWNATPTLAAVLHPKRASANAVVPAKVTTPEISENPPATAVSRSAPSILPPDQPPASTGRPKPLQLSFFEDPK